MPDHRTPSRPRHRTRQLGNWPGCRVLIAVSFTRTFRTVCTNARRTTGHPSCLRVVRAAFLAPWFAVSLGVVAAATVSSASPATTLTFPSTRAGGCAVAGCSNSRPDQGKGERPNSAAPPGGWPRKLPAPAPSLRRSPMARPRTAPRADGARIQYGLLREAHHRFMAMILITAHTRLGKWTIRMRLAGTQVSAVMWAKWSFAKSGAIVIDGRPSPWPRSAPDEARIVISGTGRPGPPSGCVYNGLSCTFAPLTGG